MNEIEGMIGQGGITGPNKPTPSKDEMALSIIYTQDKILKEMGETEKGKLISEGSRYHDKFVQLRGFREKIEMSVNPNEKRAAAIRFFYGEIQSLEERIKEYPEDQKKVQQLKDLREEVKAGNYTGLLLHLNFEVIEARLKTYTGDIMYIEEIERNEELMRLLNVHDKIISSVNPNEKRAAAIRFFYGEIQSLEERIKEYPEDQKKVQQLKDLREEVKAGNYTGLLLHITNEESENFNKARAIEVKLQDISDDTYSKLDQRNNMTTIAMSGLRDQSEELLSLQKRLLSPTHTEQDRKDALQYVHNNLALLRAAKEKGLDVQKALQIWNTLLQSVNKEEYNELAYWINKEVNSLPSRRFNAIFERNPEHLLIADALVGATFSPNRAIPDSLTSLDFGSDPDSPKKIADELMQITRIKGIEIGRQWYVTSNGQLIYDEIEEGIEKNVTLGVTVERNPIDGTYPIATRFRFDRLAAMGMHTHPIPMPPSPDDFYGFLSNDTDSLAETAVCVAASPWNPNNKQTDITIIFRTKDTPQFSPEQTASFIKAWDDERLERTKQSFTLANKDFQRAKNESSYTRMQMEINAQIQWKLLFEKVRELKLKVLRITDGGTVARQVDG